MKARGRALPWGSYLAAWAVLVGLSYYGHGWLAARGSPTLVQRESFVERLLGPFASLAASVQLVRAERALREGRPGVGFARIDSALRLDPGAPEGWSYLAYHLILERGSKQREPDPELRLAWILQGLEVLERGQGSARQPELLAFERGLYLSHLLSADPELDWPQGARPSWGSAAEAFERAAAGGHPLGLELAQKARERATGASEPQDD